MEIRRPPLDGLPPGGLVSPDATSVWPAICPIDEVWVAPDDLTLVVVGPLRPAAPRAGRAIVDEGALELASHPHHAESRRIRREIQATRRNPWRAMALPPE